jgi:long-chain acyl-CoA synthetase
MEKYNLISVFEKSIQENWDLPALSDYKGTSFTYGQVGERITRLHNSPNR